MEIYTIEALLLVFLILITCAVIFCKDILSAAIIYSAFSFCAVLLYLMMGSRRCLYGGCYRHDFYHLLRSFVEKN